jgi:hypothetical protein
MTTTTTMRSSRRAETCCGAHGCGGARKAKEKGSCEPDT